MNILMVLQSAPGPSETFLRAQAERLPNCTVVVAGRGSLHIDGKPALSQALPARATRKISRMAFGRPWEWERTAGLVHSIRRSRADVVLAHYGPTGVMAMEACRIAGVPLVVHFHGYDASRRETIARYRSAYREMFQQSAAVIAVSRAMERRLEELGCAREKIHYSPCGVDVGLFNGAAPESVPPHFLAVGRFVEKKAPHLTVLAFAEVVRQVPESRLRMIGDGPLKGVCQDLATVIGVEHSVEFLGVQTPARIAEELGRSRAFVQHSVEAADGDCEGTPVAILEAGASGVPVVSTRHTGIPDVVIHDKTGLLVDERDVSGMAKAMIRLAGDSAEARRLGQNAQRHISASFRTETQMERIITILAGAKSASASASQIAGCQY